MAVRLYMGFSPERVTSTWLGAPGKQMQLGEHQTWAKFLETTPGVLLKHQNPDRRSSCPTPNRMFDLYQHGGLGHVSKKHRVPVSREHRFARNSLAEEILRAQSSMSFLKARKEMFGSYCSQWQVSMLR